ncbi:hypothetical protein VEHSUH05_00485 [Veillonella denticariosi JCM 15641]|uniref:Yip1 domain-containing protein n=1 Tax=Veillonella denticariosi JCM 15641 TaxID=1298594 RepID=A0A2S7ZCI9_9FIRM|nr:hypothetical protein [Veillonella denticariosi]PQL20939.1 hypothetical protein VEHSUH05_00485 [Veillonella denticariosi JCM 15641]
METKWYSDFFQLLVHPFSKGIDQIVEFGTLKKGFWCTVFFWAIPYLLLALFGTMLIPLLPRNEITNTFLMVLTFAGVAFVLIWFLGILLSFIGVAIYSYIFNWVVKKMGGTDNVNAVMKVNWYLEGYGVLFGTAFYVLLAISAGILVGFFDAPTLFVVVFSISFIGMLVIMIWVSLALMGKQVMLSKLKVFLACVITSLIILIIYALFIALLNGCASLVGR